jgi:hypothetical protein
MRGVTRPITLGADVQAANAPGRSRPLGELDQRYTGEQESDAE